MDEIQEHLMNEELKYKQLAKQFNKTEEDLNKLKADFNEEKAMNEQLMINQNQLRNEMKKKKKVKKCFFFYLHSSNTCCFLGNGHA